MLGEWHFNMACNVLEDIFEVVLGPPPLKWARLPFRDNGWPVASPRSGTDTKNITTHEYGQEPLDPDEDLKAKVYGIWDESRSRPDMPLGSSAVFWKVDTDVVPHWGNVEGGFPHIHPDEAAQFLDLLTRTFIYDVGQRITAAEILKHPWLVSVER